jgi:hypothetical protein
MTPSLPSQPLTEGKSMNALRGIKFEWKVDWHLIVLVLGFIGVGYTSHYRLGEVEVAVKLLQAETVALEKQDGKLREMLIRTEERHIASVAKQGAILEKVQKLDKKMDDLRDTLHRHDVEAARTRYGNQSGP